MPSPIVDDAQHRNHPQFPCARLLLVLGQTPRILNLETLFLKFFLKQPITNLVKPE